jgi:hypothetical protein
MILAVPFAAGCRLVLNARHDPDRPSRCLHRTQVSVIGLVELSPVLGSYGA